MKFIATTGTDGIEVIKVAYFGQPIDFTTLGVTKVDVIAGGVTTAAVFQDGELWIKFGKMGLAPGKYDVRIMLFTAGSPDGVEIMGPLRPHQGVLFIN